eukprot:Unigene5266_Nuclearia_a/m.16168 Unigene5266_Nuclearia_a/g.16168  ORF Unigene5266_Nuclearia_a/g.16168 Unigene5266_Nuclearia_a/m.16168 type:complete len:116 (-) Unigene5266_Nuclearia_a:88-435(-)
MDGVVRRLVSARPAVLVPVRGKKRYFVNPEKFPLTIVHTNGATIKSFTLNPTKPVWRLTVDSYNHPFWQHHWQYDKDAKEEAVDTGAESATLTDEQKSMLDDILQSGKGPRRRVS